MYKRQGERIERERKAEHIQQQIQQCVQRDQRIQCADDRPVSYTHLAFHDNVLPAMDTLRAAADDAETICGEDYWPMPSYSKMLYYV